jgi:hypothetical protein
MKSIHIAGLLALGLTVAGCATSTTEPVAVQTLTQQQMATLHLKEVTAQAAPGVTMTQLDFDRICLKVKSQLEATSPGIFVDAANPNAATAATMKLNFTQYDSGSAFARAMLIGLGQIHIDADVVLVDSSGNTEAQYKVSKQFAFGGIYGAVTRIEDVEDGFAKSVAEIVKPKK